MTDAVGERQFLPVRIAVLTVSNTRTLADDTSGQVLCDRIAEAGHLLSARKIVADDIRAIRHVIRDWANRRGPAAMVGMRSSSRSSTPATGRAISSRSCRACRNM